jgi:hypothetical protein
MINDNLIGNKTGLSLVIEEYVRLIVPNPIESLTVSYMGSGGWRIDVGVNENVYNFLNQKDRGRFRRTTIKERFEWLIQEEMSKMFPFTFEAFIVLSL